MMAIDYKTSILSWINNKHFYINDAHLNIDLNEKGYIDLSEFKRLKSLGCNFKEIKNYGHLSNLETIGLSGYKDGNSLISNNKNLIDLSLTQCSLTNLSELNNLNQLKNVDLYSCSKLVDISGLRNKSNIEKLEIESCKNIPVSHLIEVISTLKHLEVLKLHKFEFPDLNWISELPNLVDFVITDCNVINGDISPAAHLEYVAIDNRKHYNYRFDSETRTIQPVVPKGVYIPKPEKASKSTFEVPHFGPLDLKHLNQDYETDMAFGESRVNLELHFEEDSTTKNMLKRLMKLLKDVETNNKTILDLLKTDFEQGGVVNEYYDYFLDESIEGDEQTFWKELSLKRMAFYPDDDDSFGVYDYGIDEISPYVLSLKINQKGAIVGCEMES